jgi:rhamnose utilization protein RhaD (predicted bifunctional aldolase and dehydrogenase)
MSEPERTALSCFALRHLLGSDKRITNYGGGNTSAKVRQKDPLTGEKVEVLWVKGSGGDSRFDQARRLRDALSWRSCTGSEGLYRGLDARGRDGRLPAALHLQPQSARRLDRHAAARLRAYLPYVDHMHPDAIIAIAARRFSRR